MFWGGSAFATLISTGEWIPRADLAARFRVAPVTWDHVREEFQLKPFGPGAFAQMFPGEAHEVDSVTRIGRTLAARDALSLALISRLGRARTPRFDGLVIDEMDRIVGAFSLKRTINLGFARNNAQREHLEDLAAFAETAPWVRVALNQAGAMLKHGDVPEYRFVNPAQRACFENYIRLHRAFVATPPRESWLIIDYDVNDVCPTALDEVHARLSEHQPGVRVVASLGGELRSFCEGRLLGETGVAKRRAARAYF